MGGAVGLADVATDTAGRIPDTTPSTGTPAATNYSRLERVGRPTAVFRTNTCLAADSAAHAGPDAQDAPAGHSDRETCAGLCWI
jgi:hypothetical protein